MIRAEITKRMIIFLSINGYLINKVAALLYHTCFKRRDFCEDIIQNVTKMQLLNSNTSKKDKLRREVF